MKAYFVIIIFGILSFGCATQQKETVSPDLISGIPGEKIIHERLEQEPIALPITTPFDSDTKKRQAYLDGFQEAWDYVVNGSFLHGTKGFSIPDGMEEPWKAGWKEGCKIASNRWSQEYTKWRDENSSQQILNPSP